MLTLCSAYLKWSRVQSRDKILAGCSLRHVTGLPLAQVMGTLPVPTTQGAGVFEFMNYDCLDLVLNGAELLFGSFSQNAHAVADFWLGFANRILATWKLVAK